MELGKFIVRIHPAKSLSLSLSLSSAPWHYNMPTGHKLLSNHQNYYCYFLVMKKKEVKKKKKEK